jgi:hypothetical protein
VAIDLQIYSHAKCGRCANRRPKIKAPRYKVKAQHRGYEYRIVRTCPVCGFVETF